MNKGQRKALLANVELLNMAKWADDARAADAHDLSVRNGITVLPVSATAPKAVVGRLPPEAVAKIKAQVAGRRGGKQRVTTVELKNNGKKAK